MMEIRTKGRARPRRDMTGKQLRKWRTQQAGEHAYRNNQKRPGWTQAQAAEWYGVSERQWARYESGESGIPLSLVKRMISYESSFDETISRIWDTPKDLVSEMGGIHPELAHEKGRTG